MSTWIGSLSDAVLSVAHAPAEKAMLQWKRFRVKEKSEMSIPTVDVRGKLFTERDRKLLAILLRPEGGTLEAINRAIAVRAPAWGYMGDATRLAARIGGTEWSNGHGGTRRFGIRLPEAAAS
jgi:hypothetical protein